MNDISYTNIHGLIPLYMLNPPTDGSRLIIKKGELMKRILLLVICAMLIGCVTENMNTMALKIKWEDKPFDNYIRMAGKPDQTFSAPNGNTIHTYYSYDGKTMTITVIEVDSSDRIIYWNAVNTSKTR